MGSLRYRYPPQQALIGAQANSSRLSMGRAEEQLLVRAVAAGVEVRANVLLRQLEDADHHGIGGFLPFCFALSWYVSFLIVGGLSCVRGDRGAVGSLCYGQRLPRLPRGRPRS
jgi:hypothetical protein